MENANPRLRSFLQTANHAKYTNNAELFAYFAYFAVHSIFYIGTDYEGLPFVRCSLVFAVLGNT
jgi:hypothetical protein